MDLYRRIDETMEKNRAALEHAQQNQWEQKPVWEKERQEREMEKRQRAQFSNIGLVGTAFMLVNLVAQIGMIVCMGFIDGRTAGALHLLSNTGLMFISAVSMYLIAFPIALALLQAIPKCKEPSGESWGAEGFLVVLVISMGIGLVGNLLGQAVELFKPASGLSGENLEGLLMSSNVWVNLLCTAVLAPVVEELLFRKLLMDRLLGYGEWAAVLVSGFMFGMAHGNFGQFFYAFGLGLVWAYMYAKTGRVSFTIVLHMIFNLMGGVMVTELLKGLDGDTGGFGIIPFLERICSVDLSQVVIVVSGMALLGYILLMVGCVIGGITLLIVFRRKIKFSPGIWPIKKGRRFRTVFFNPGMIIYFLVCVMLFVLSW